MKKIPLTSSLLVYLDELEYSEAALAAEPEVAEYAQAVRDQIAAWETMFKSEREARRNVTRADAIVSVSNVQIDELTVRFGAEVLVEARGDRKSTFFRRFFKGAPSEFVRSNLRAQCEQTLNAILPELASVDEKSRLKPYAVSLKAAAEKALGALDSRGKIKASRGSVAHDVEEWKDGVNTLRLTTYADLLKLAATNSHSRAWADTFFRVDAHETGRDVETPVPAPAPDEGPGA